MAVQKFEDLFGWQKGQDLAVSIYATFNKIKDYAFKDQICRASVSVSNNIAEGFDRNTNADFRRFLFIAIASCSEVKSMLYLAHRLNFITEEERINLLLHAEEVSKIIRGLIKSLK